MFRTLSRLVLAAACTLALPATAAEYDAQLKGFEYPHKVKRFKLQSQGQELSMAYMDISPSGRANGESVLLLHGKNYCSATWEKQITALSKAGYRVIAVDQIGFCKSEKPEHYHFSLQQLAANTRALLDKLGIERSHVIGHSMGGMLAVRYGLMYPQASTRLVLVNPIGLEDWQAAGVPWRSLDDWFEREKQTSAESLRQYQEQFYFNGQWKPEYDRWVEMLAGMYAGPDGERVAWNQAQASDMIFTQPVLYEFPNLAVPTALMIGQDDRTAIGRDLAPQVLQARLGNYPELGQRAMRAMPYASLVDLDGLGHSPHIEDPERFNQIMLAVLKPR